MPSFDAKYFASLGGQDDNSVVIWETETGRAVCGSPAAQDSALCVKWLHRRNDRFVTAGNFHVRVWQVDVSIPKVRCLLKLRGSATARALDDVVDPCIPPRLLVRRCRCLLVFLLSPGKSASVARDGPLRRLAG